MDRIIPITAVAEIELGVSMLSVPFMFRATPETLPGAPYLLARQELIADASAMPASRPSIRTLPPGIFLAIDDIPGVRLFGLGERSAIQQGLAKLPIINFGTHTLTQAAANIVALDLVVTVDTMSPI